MKIISNLVERDVLNFRKYQRKKVNSRGSHGDGRIADRDPKKVLVLSLDTPGRL